MIPVDSRIEEVVVYARGARVRRVTTLGTVATRIAFGDLPLAVIDDTVRVSVDGPAIAISVRIGVEAQPAENVVAEEALEVRDARRQLGQAEAEIARLQSGLEQLSASHVIAEDDDHPGEWSAVVTARRAIVGLRAARELALREALSTARRSAETARRELATVLDRDRRGGTARPPKLHELRKQVEIELVANGDPGPLEVHLEYVVEAARWVPSYVARITPDARAVVELRAAVAQDTGEDWSGVPLRLSTAEPTRFAPLPELAAQRIGRRQPAMNRGGFRPPPRGAIALYADYERDLARAGRRPRSVADEVEDLIVPEPVADAPEIPSAFAGEVWDEESSAAKERFATPPRGTSAPPARAYDQDFDDDGIEFEGDLKKRSMAAPKPAPQAMMARLPRAASEAIAVTKPRPPVPRLDYTNLVMAPPSSPSRGTLIEPPDPHTDAIAQAVALRVRQVIQLEPPAGCDDDWSHAYDYAYTTDGNVEVRADGAWHSIAVTARPAEVSLHHVAVPREQADVFRMAAIANPFEGPLLPGPIDVYDNGRFLVTSEVEHTPPRARVEIGLGVDPRVKIARNTEFEEETTGMLRGSLRLHHAVAIDVDNLSGVPVDLEVRERIPVTVDGDDDIDVTIGRVDPPWERWAPDADGPASDRLRGGHRWQLRVPAGGKTKLRVAYEVKIPSKAELVGGNRRES